MINVPTPEEIHKNAVEHGWWERPRNIFEMLALSTSEGSEALEEYRNQKEGWEDRFYIELADKYIRLKDQKQAEDEGLVSFETKDKKDLTVPEKIGIIQASIFRLSINETIELIETLFDKEKLYNAIVKKHEYNKTRPYKHGGKAC